MTFPTVTVEMSFSTGPLDTPSWEEIDVKAVTTKTGRSARFNEYQPGTAALVVNNREREFDPLHASGPHFGELTPNKRMRVTAVYDGTTYDVFTGFVNGWPQSYAPPSESELTVKATDGLKLLNRMRLPDDQYDVEVLADTPRLWYRFDETSGLTIRDSSGNGRDALGDIDVSSVAGDGLLPCSANGGVTLDVDPWECAIPREHLAFDFDPITVEFWFQCDRPPQTEGVNGIIAGVSDVFGPGLSLDIFVNYTDEDGSTFGAPTPGGYVWFGIIQAQPSLAFRQVVASQAVCDGVPHHIMFTRSGSTLKAYVDGIDRTSTAVPIGTYTATTGNRTSINLGYGWDKWAGASSPRLDEFAIYDTALSQADAVRHYEAGAILWDGDLTGERLERVLDVVGWPAGDRDLDTGQAVLGPARWDPDTKALAYGRLLEATEQGTLYIDHRDGGKLRFRSRHAALASTESTVSQATFTDELGDDTNVHYSGIEIDYDETEIVNSVTVNWVGGSVTVTDATSVADNGEQTLTISTLLEDPAEAVGLGEWVVSHLKDPKVRVRSITVKATGRRPGSTQADTTWEQVLGRKFGDRVTVIRHPQGVGDPIETDVIIDGIDHQIGGVGAAGGINTWTTRFSCTPAETFTYWVLGTSELGTDTRLAL